LDCSFSIGFVFFTAEGAESAEEEGKRGDGSLLDAFLFDSFSIGFVFFYRQRAQRTQRKRGREGMGHSWTLFNVILSF
jgi:hypothetical protein